MNNYKISFHIHFRFSITTYICDYSICLWKSNTKYLSKERFFVIFFLVIEAFWHFQFSHEILNFISSIFLHAQKWREFFECLWYIQLGIFHNISYVLIATISIVIFSEAYDLHGANWLQANWRDYCKSVSFDNFATRYFHGNYHILW